jgi:hypothetical protein
LARVLGDTLLALNPFRELGGGRVHLRMIKVCGGTLSVGPMKVFRPVTAKEQPLAMLMVLLKE